MSRIIVFVVETTKRAQKSRPDKHRLLSCSKILNMRIFSSRGKGEPRPNVAAGQDFKHLKRSFEKFFFATKEFMLLFL